MKKGWIRKLRGMSSGWEYWLGHLYFNAPTEAFSQIYTVVELHFGTLHLTPSFWAVLLQPLVKLHSKSKLPTPLSLQITKFMHKSNNSQNGGSLGLAIWAFFWLFWLNSFQIMVSLPGTTFTAHVRYCYGPLVLEF